MCQREIIGYVWHKKNSTFFSNTYINIGKPQHLPLCEAWAHMDMTLLLEVNKFSTSMVFFLSFFFSCSHRRHNCTKFVMLYFPLEEELFTYFKAMWRCVAIPIDGKWYIVFFFARLHECTKNWVGPILPLKLHLGSGSHGSYE